MLLEPPSLHPVINPNRCAGCAVCADACPEAGVLGIIDGKAELVSPANCIGHGACKTACPFDAITLGNEYEIAEYSRDDLIYTKDMLLEPPIKRVPVADRDRYDTPEPVWKTES